MRLKRTFARSIMRLKKLVIKKGCIADEIILLKQLLKEKESIIEQQNEEIIRLSSVTSVLPEIEKLLTVSNAELNGAVNKIENSTNNAIVDLGNINSLFSSTINSTKELVLGIKEKLNLMADKDSVTTDGPKGYRNQSDDIRGKYEVIINHILKEMQSIVERKKDDIALLDSVNDHFDGIKNFTKEVSGIASISNILSINAKCEAAHAGEWGRTFSVVASEIGRLSHETRAFAAKIDGNLKTAKESIENTTIALKKAIDIESSFINSTIYLMRDVFMSIIDGLISLINLIEKTIGESSEINNNMQNVIVNLQFEDITKQISQHVMHVISTVTDGFRMVNDQECKSENAAIVIDNLAKGIHNLFTMESERKIASAVIEDNNVVMNGSDNEANANQPAPDEVIFF